MKGFIHRRPVRKRVFSMCATVQLFALAVLLVPIAAAQQVGKVPRIGLLVPTSASRTAAFRQGLRDLGHVRGPLESVATRHRWHPRF